MEINLEDRQIVTEIVNNYSDMIMRIAYQNVNNYQESEDIMQEVFLSLLKKSTFKDPEHLKAWLIRVTLNKCRDYLRSKRNRHIPLDEVQNCLFTPDQHKTLEELYELPEIDRNIIYLHYYEGYTAAEIGKILKKSENSIFLRLTRARQKLKHILEKEESENE
ncbi:MAG: sigma-70 family RNA polymerase sigma factor [Clostridia bacterium]|nr:sigma-70 family RNA polymerase sigma factor [Clostridia bacterium]